jgi:hypothetical protein
LSNYIGLGVYALKTAVFGAASSYAWTSERAFERFEIFTAVFLKIQVSEIDVIALNG